MNKQYFLAPMAVLALWTSVGSAQSLANGSLESSNTCVIVYVKNDNSQPNLTIACDGERVLTHVVKTENQLEDSATFKAELFMAFQGMVNSEHQKKCEQYDLEQVWWATCHR